MEANEFRTPIVNVTTDYGQFHFDPANRDIDPRHLARLVDSIRSKNMLSDRPINVTADGTVLDGQHRLLAARELNVPIYYIISDVMTVDDVPGLNDEVRKWTPEAYLKLWCQYGNEEYLFVRDLHKKYPEILLSTLTDLLAYGDRVGHQRRWARGLFKAIRRRFAVVVIEGARDFAPYISWWREARFIQAIASLFDTEGYSHERMIRKVRRQTGKLMPQTSVDDYLSMLSSIYNFQQQEPTHIIFKNRSYTKRRQMYGDSVDLDADHGEQDE